MDRKRRSSAAFGVGAAPPACDDASAERRLAGPVAALVEDARHAARVVRRHPGGTAVAAATIALGVAAVTLLASVVWGVLLKPLPWPEAERLVRIYETRQGGATRFGQVGPVVTNGAYLAWSDSPTTIEAIAAWQPTERTLTGIGPAERMQMAASTASLPDLLRARPFVGRWFDQREQDDSAHVVVLAYGFWRDRFAANPGIVGRALRLDGVPHTVLGVMPQEFRFPDRDTRAWVPLPVPTVIDPNSRSGRLRMFSAMARLRPGYTAAQAAAEATARTRATSTERALGMAVFGSGGPADVIVVSALDDAIQHVRPALLWLLAAVGLLLLTSAANVANVQLARATGRRREMAIRGALGAAGGRLGRQLLFENLLLALLGGIAGTLLAGAGHLALPALLPSDFPRADEIAINWPAVAVAIAASAVSGLATGLVPAVHARHLNVAETLAENNLSVAGGGRRIRVARAVVMTIQVAAAVVLLVSAALLVRSFSALLEADRGFDVSRVLTAELPLPPADNMVVRRNALLEPALERLAGIPGIRAAGFTSILPLTGSESMRAFDMPDRRGDGSIITARASFRVVSPYYFQAMGMRVAVGRGLTDDDTARGRQVVVVNRSFARAYLDDTPLGEEVPFDGPGEWHVVGVVDDIRAEDGRTASPELFVSYRQWRGRPGGNPMIAVRAAGDPEDLAIVLRGIIRDLDPELALGDVRTLEDRLEERLARPRLYSIVIAGFSALALVIAAVGLFGVLSCTVAQRSRELAVRTALGATPQRVVGLVVRQALALTIAGLLIGFAASAMLGRVTSAYLFGVTSHDPATFAMVAVVLMAVTCLACAVPALRAVRVDPAVVLRE